MTNVKARLKYFRLSPRKVRLVVDLIRGLSVSRAMEQLEFSKKRSSDTLLKLLNSAVANAKNNFKLEKENLFISEITVDKGPTLKRWLPRARGRATPINKRSSHISVTLSDKK